MAIVISGNGIDMGGNPVSNASQIDGTVINENGNSVRTENDIYSTGGFKNLLINPNFTVNIRDYISGTSTTTSNQYCHDRWRVPTSGQSVAFTTANGVTTVAAPASGYEQVIENINNIGGTFTLSNQGTATATVSQSADNVTYTTVTPNADGSYIITGGYHVKINFSNGTIIKPQFELGTVPTIFENRFKTDEELLCFRYLPYVKGENILSTCGGITATNLRYLIYTVFPVEVRVAPTGLVNTALINFNITDGTTISETPTSISFQSAGLRGVRLWVYGTSTTTNIAGRPAFLVGTNANAKIYFTGCEL